MEPTTPISKPSPASPTDYDAVRPTINLRSVTRAFIGDDAEILKEDDENAAGAGNVTLTANATSLANADVDYVGISAFLSVGVSSVEANVGHDVLEPSDSRSDDGNAAGLRLCCDEPERLAARRDHHHVGSPVELCELVVRNGFMEVDDTCEIRLRGTCDETLHLCLATRSRGASDH